MMPDESQNLSKTSNHSFLQTRQWEEFNNATGFKTWRLPGRQTGLPAGRQGVDGVLAIKVPARRAAFLHIPHLPFFSKELSGELINLAKSEKCAFLRVSPLILDSPENRQIFASLGFRKAPLYIHPEFAWILNIDRNENEILSGMRKTTRYSVRKAEKDGVKTCISDDPEGIEKFWKLYEVTAKRQKFVPFSKKYIETEFRAFGENAFWVLSDHAAAMIVLTENEGFYHHGASTHHPTASYAVQWAAISETRRRGKMFYNFWGVWNDPKSPQVGLSNFKRGFGGFEEAYVPAQDFPITRRYWINTIVERAIKMRRGF